MPIITFATADVRKLVEHAAGCALHRPNFAQCFQAALRHDGREVGDTPRDFASCPKEADVDPSRVPAGLWLVGDQGVYLMSNGIPALVSGTSINLVAYASGMDPSKDGDAVWDRKREAFGGDDGCEFLPLDSFERALRTNRTRLSIMLTGEVLAVIAGAGIVHRAHAGVRP